MLLWRHIRAKQLEGLKFRRQQPIGNCIVDFICIEKRVIIQLGGGQHSFDPEKNKDLINDKGLEEQGYNVLRFRNNDITKNMNGVLKMIRDACL